VKDVASTQDPLSILARHIQQRLMRLNPNVLAGTQASVIMTQTGQHEFMASVGYLVAMASSPFDALSLLDNRLKICELAAEGGEAARAERVARLFHEVYEALAPSHGYETRSESRVPWEDVDPKLKTLMVATVTEVLRREDSRR
jgi:hypothetical protein